MTLEPFDLQRFRDAQSAVWPDVTRELQAGRKQTHWMWFVFPQLAALGRSATARHFGLSGLDEAAAYLADPILGMRLRQCCALLLDVHGRTADDIFGAVDAMKLRSCLTLFGAVPSSDASVFGSCLQRYFGGSPDPLTLSQIRPDA